MPTELRRPSPDLLPHYRAALARGWAPDSTREAALAATLERDPAAFLALLEDPEAKGAPVALPDGSRAPRLPSRQFWIWDSGFAGVVNLRWTVGGGPLPDYVLGHIGYNVVPWRRGEGLATRALALALPEARKVGLVVVEVSTDAENLASQRVILANGGQLVRRFAKPAVHGGGAASLFRIALT